MKPLFDLGPDQEQKKNFGLLQTEVFLHQEELLTKEFNALKIRPASGASQKHDAKLTGRDLEALEKTHQLVRDLSKADALRVSESLLKQQSDPKYLAYSKLIDGFLKSALK